MGDPANGLLTAAAALGSTGLPAPSADEQLDLLATLGAEGAALPLGERRPGGELIGTHGGAAAGRAGRPKGAGNKRTAAVRDYLLARYRHPLEALAALYSMPTADLARDLDCDRKDALALQVRAAEKVAEYVESKMPTALAVSHDADVPMIVINQLGGAVQVAGGTVGRAFDLDAVPAIPPMSGDADDIVENQ